MSLAHACRIVLLGPPGAGKGTQAQKLARRLGIPHISTGAILRAEAARGTDLGRRAAALMERGELVPDDVVLEIVQARLEQDDCRRGFILDGFPRSLAQAEALERECGVASAGLRVLSLDVPSEELVKRMVLRGRKDDREDVIRARLEVYRQQTEPLIAFYRERGALVPIDGIGSTEEVFERLMVQLGSCDGRAS